MLDLVIRTTFHEFGSDEDQIRQILEDPDGDLDAGLVVFLIEKGRVSQNFLAEILRSQSPIQTPFQKLSLRRIKEAAAFCLMSLTQHPTDLEGRRVAVIDFLAEGQLVKDHKGLTPFLDYCLLTMDPGWTQQRLEPIKVAKAAVIYRRFEQLIRYAHRKPIWAAIPLLWKLVTTLSDGRRITLAEAFQLRHELHAASTLLVLYAQTPYAGGDQPGYEINTMFRWESFLVVDKNLVEWFHGPYLQPQPAS